MDGKVGHFEVIEMFGAESSADALPSAASVRTRSELSSLVEQRSRSVLVRDAAYKRTLAVVDLMAGAAALAVSRVVVGHAGLTVAAVATLPLIVLFAHLAGLYDRDAYLLHKTTLEEAPALCQIAAVYSLLTWLMAGLTMGGEFSPSQAAALWGLLFGFMLAGRRFGRLAVGQLTPQERCVVLGDARSAVAMQRKFEHSLSVKATVVGRIPLDDPSEDELGQTLLPVLGRLASMRRTLIEYDIHRVIVVPNGLDHNLDTIRLVKTLGVRVSVLPRMLEVIGSSFELDDVDGVALLGVGSSQLTRSSRLLKRMMDLTLAGVGLVVLAPLLAVIAAAIKLASPGPVLYRQRRIGRDELEFDMLKFRSMVDGADTKKAQLLHLNETQGLFKIANDPRTTPVGRLLRRTSLDELPQLWNVIRGEMSLVGPRPLVPDDDAKIVGWQRNRLNLTPGVTGPWQILGSTRSPLEEMVTIDYLYGASWSLWLDVKIILRTLGYMASRGSA
jgi:exopolysaccharide biosynthesis polyprenyl glycosylphosphotransferase